MSLPGCNVCGEPPIYTVTAAGNHTLRCDGNPIGGEPRHTLYVWHKTKDGVEELWAKASRQGELADLRAYKERTEAGLHKLSAMVDHCGEVTEGEMRVFGLWRDPPQAEVQP